MVYFKRYQKFKIKFQTKNINIMKSYIKARVKLLKSSLNEIQDFNSPMYIVLSSVMDELQYTLELHEKDVISNSSTSEIINDTIKRANNL